METKLKISGVTGGLGEIPDTIEGYHGCPHGVTIVA